MILVKRAFSLFLIVTAVFCFVSCNKQDAVKSDKGGSVVDKIKTAVSSPKDLILGTWAIDDLLVDGKSQWTPEQKQQAEKNPNERIVYVFEKDKFKAYAGGQLIEGTYKWLDDNNIETTSISLGDGKTETSKARVEAAADKLSIYADEKMATQ